MRIKNKLDKFLLGLSSFFLAALIILSLKVKDDNNKLVLIKEESKTLYNLENITATQKLIVLDREKTLNKIENLPKNASVIKTTTKTIAPAKTVTQPAPINSFLTSPVVPQTSQPRKTRTS
jgi:hypothetical protein